ncbi:MAG: hypothetical protein FJ263_08075 [Planctomycetes bacterium]|nr:hypothetical protein [Planctomycetota bacterium]
MVTAKKPTIFLPQSSKFKEQHREKRINSKHEARNPKQILNPKPPILETKTEANKWKAENRPEKSPFASLHPPAGAEN